MDNIGIFEAKTRLSEIIERVVREGRPVTITRRGVPVVDIVPTRESAVPKMSREEAFAEMRKLRKEIPRCSMEEILELIAQGRR